MGGSCEQCVPLRTRGAPLASTSASGGPHVDAQPLPLLRGLISLSASIGLLAANGGGGRAPTSGSDSLLAGGGSGCGGLSWGGGLGCRGASHSSRVADHSATMTHELSDSCSISAGPGDSKGAGMCGLANAFGVTGLRRDETQLYAQRVEAPGGAASWALVSEPGYASPSILHIFLCRSTT